MRKKKWLAVILCAVIVLTTLPTSPISADGGSGGTTVLSSATGSEPRLTTNIYDLDSNGVKDSVYEIASAAQLEWFANYVNNNHSNSNAVLVADIDLTGYTHTPIGVNNSEFKGMFDGKGHKITNMNFTTAQNGYGGNLTYNYQGLFGIISGGAVVRNFTISGEVILITDSQKFVGGAVGLAYGNSTISNIKSYVDINDNDIAYRDISQIGGVVGMLGSSNDGTKGTVKNCQYYGTINIDTAASVGGIAGQGTKYSVVSDCDNYGTIGWNYIGHVAGVIGSAQVGTSVTNCVNYGSVSVCRNDCVGGVVGYANEYVTITNCINAGAATAKKSTISDEPDVYLGGILGYVNNSSFGGITKCVNFGSVTASDNGTTYTGGIVGYVKNVGNNSKINSNYWIASSSTNAYGSGGNKPGAPTEVTAITSSSTALSAGWYIASGDVTIESRITVTGDVKLFIADNANLIVNGGINVTDNDDNISNGSANALTIYAQSAPVLAADGSIDSTNNKTGKLTIQNVRNAAGIGSNNENGNAGTITINGGIITSTGVSGGAGIGGGSFTSGGNTTINGGFITAMANKYSQGSGIGGGYKGGAGNIIINGGTVTAIGGLTTDLSSIGGSTTGIGGGCDSTSGSIVINGGTLNAFAGTSSNAIGSSASSGKIDSITINGGIVNAASKKVGIGGSNVITINGFEKITSSSNEDYSSFDVEPTLSDEVRIIVSVGSSLDALTPVKYSDDPLNALLNNQAAQIDHCSEHVTGSIISDANYHKVSCKWCGDALSEGAHSFNEDGACDCGFWNGTYLYYNSTSKNFETKTASLVPMVKSEDTELKTGWYVAYGDVTVDNRITITGDVNIIVANGANLVINGGIKVQDEDKNINNGSANTLTIYAQSAPTLKQDGTIDDANNKTGKITIQNVASGNAGIGSDHSYRPAGVININGGIITTKGGENGAGIGGGNGTAGGNITINGGFVTAMTDASGKAAGIGGGSSRGSAGNITINGGTVNAYGGSKTDTGMSGYSSAAIGCGYFCDSNAGTIVINGGNINAFCGDTANAIGASYGGKGGSITINGGNINANSVSKGSGIGGTNWTVTINGFEQIMASTKGNSSAFSVTPTVSSSIKLIVSAGDSYDALTAVDASDALTALTSNLAVKMLICESHTAGSYIYKDENTHISICKWCGTQYEEEHVIGESGICVCGIWSGNYLDYNEDSKEFETKTATDILKIKNSDTALSAGWYVVCGDITIDSRLTITGDVHIILEDGSNFVVNGGIDVSDDDTTNGTANSLTIYTQSAPALKADGSVDDANNTAGKLTVQGVSANAAGIGGGDGKAAGKITIDGGILNVSGGSNASGIGGGNGGAGGNTTINGGVLIISGGENASGIGGGNGGAAGTITINGLDNITVNGAANAFGTTPTIYSELKLHVSAGASLDALTSIELSNISSALGSNAAVKITVCGSHVAGNSAVYVDESTHSDNCKWCGTPFEGAHVFGEDGACACGAWKGTYLDYNEISKTFETKTTPVIKMIKSSDTELTAGWYVAYGNVTIASRLTITGEVHIVIADGADLVVNGGIEVSDDDNDNTNGSPNSLAIYAQSNPVLKSDGTIDEENNKTGKLTAQNVGESNPGIGGYIRSGYADITIDGGIITSAGGKYAAGIGGGNFSSTGVITINGGFINATGGGCASGIGGGYYPGNDTIITINGGTINASCVESGVGLGVSRGDGTHAVNITINGGTICAIGVSNTQSSWYHPGIDNCKSTAITVTINSVDKLTVVGGVNAKAFGVAPIFAEDLLVRIAKGDSIDSLKDVWCRDRLDTYYTTCKAIKIQKCVDHENYATYKDSDKHTISCKWCGADPHDEAHSFNSDNACICNIWHGSYLDYNYSTNAFYTKTITSTIPIIESNYKTLSAGWYAVYGNVTIDGSIKIEGDVHIILVDGACLTVTDGIDVCDDDDDNTNGSANKLTVYAQSTPILTSDGSIDEVNNQTGKLVVTRKSSNAAAIGSSYYGIISGMITINGGILDVKVESTTYVAGIGGVYNSTICDITINGGALYIKASKGAAIGTGEFPSEKYGKITINGGTIDAKSEGYYAIGGRGIGVDVNGGTITAYTGKSNYRAFSSMITLNEKFIWNVYSGSSLEDLTLVTSREDALTQSPAVKLVAMPEVINIEITWTSMAFTYDDGEWDEKTHTYSNGGWSSTGGNVTVTNNGNATIKADVEYSGAVSDITGEFNKPSLKIGLNSSDTTTLSLSGKPSAAIDGVSLGTITVTVGRYIEGWIIDGESRYYYKDGQKVVGWCDINGSKYYFNEEGVMMTDWQDIDGRWYYFGADGKYDSTKVKS